MISPYGFRTMRASGRSGRHLVFRTLMLIALLGVVQVVFGAEIPVTNGDFEAGLTRAGTVPGWQAYDRSVLGVEVSLSDELVYSGRYSIRIQDTSSDKGVGLRSERIPAQPGVFYTASAYVYNQSGNSQLYLEFWNERGQRIDTVIGSSSAREEWVPITAAKEAPEGTVSVSVLLYSHIRNVGVLFFDDVKLQAAETANSQDDAKLGTLTNLGGQVMRIVTTNGTVFTGADGRPYQAVLQHGIPAKMLVIDVHTLKVVDALDIPDTTNNYAIITGDDGNVYIGTHGTGRLFRYRPGASALEDLGRAIASETHIYDFTNGPDGKIYGGTYPGGKVFELDTRTGRVRDLGVAVPGQAYVRAIDYDHEEGVLYVGTGTAANIIRWNLVTGEKSENLLDRKYVVTEYPNSLSVVGDRIFAQLNVWYRMVVLDKKTGEVVAELEDAAAGVLPSPDGKKVYVYRNGDGNLYTYDFATDQFEFHWPVARYGSWAAFGIVELNQPLFTGQVLVAWLGNNAAMKYNLATRRLIHGTVDVPPQPIEITHIAGGPDGKVYTGGHQGGLGIYDPVTGESTSFSGISQAHYSSVLGDNIYFGIYPHARINVIDTTRPLGSGNPRELFRLQEYLQDRPFGVLAVEEYNKLFVGTVAQYGQLAGAFAVYDLKSGDLKVMRGLVPDQSVLALAYKDGKVYGGTSIWGSLGAPPPTATEGKLFVWDIEKEEKVLEITPVPGVRGVTELIVGPDGNIWGFAEGYIFIFDPEREEVVYSHLLTPTRYSGTTWKDAWMVVGRDGNVYGTARNIFFKMDGVTKEIAVLDVDHRFEMLAQDKYGNLYMRSGIAGARHELWQYSHPDLVGE